MEENFGVFKGKSYRAVDFLGKDKDDTACNHCAFELGKCKAAIVSLGQCYIKEGEDILLNIYYEEVKKEEEN